LPERKELGDEEGGEGRDEAGGDGEVGSAIPVAEERLDEE
jgi:hypothetical protein